MGNPHCMTFIDYEKALDLVHIPVILQGTLKQERGNLLQNVRRYIRR